MRTMSLPLSPSLSQSGRKITPLFINKVDIIHGGDKRQSLQGETKPIRIIAAFLVLILAAASLAGIDRTILVTSLVSFVGFALILFGTTILVCDLSSVMGTFMQRRYSAAGSHHIFMA
jgi:hypothetical protein